MVSRNLKTEQILAKDNIYFGKIPEDWEWKIIDEIKKDKKALVSGPFGSNIGKRFFRPTGVPVIRGNNLKQDKFVDSGFVFVDDEKADELKNCVAVQDDIIFTAAGTIGQVGIIPKNGKYSKYIISNKQLRLRINTDVISSLFAFYWFSSKKMQGYLISNNVGSALPLLTLRELKSVPIPIPSISEQNKITKILNDFYEKIQHFQNQNTILEQTIHTIFKSWFVDFDGVTEFEDSEFGKIPKGWGIKKFDELFQIFAGGDLSKISFSKTKSNEYKYPVYSNSLNNKGLYGYSKTYQYETECVTVTARGEVGRAEYRNNFFSAIVRLLVLKPKYDFSCSYATSFINLELDFSHVGSAVNQLTAPAISNRLIVVPPSNLLENFEKIFYPLQKKIDFNATNISTLKQISDAILPKLMSGEIRV